MATLTELLTGKNALQLYNESLTWLSDPARGNFKITNWRTGGPYKTLIELQCFLLEKVYQVSSTVASAILLDYSAGEWLTLLARHWYQEERIPAQFTIGKVVVTLPVGVGPYSIPAGGLTVSTPSGLKYRSTNAAQVDLNPNTATTIQVKSESPGGKYNVAPGTSISVIDSPSLLGATVANPVQGATGNWFDTDGNQGADEEEDDKLKTRCRGKWATLPIGSWTADGYVSWALKASASVIKVKVASNYRNGGFQDRWITLILAGPAGAVGAGPIAAVKSFILPRLGNCDELDVVSAANKNIAVTATVYMRAADATTANQTRILDNLALEQKYTPIGGVVYDDKLIKLLHGGADPRIGQVSVSGVVNVDPVAPLGDTVLLFNETAVLQPTITWVAV